MVFKYLKFSIRNIIKHRNQSAIHALGISLGLSCALIVILYVQYELSYDRYHEHANDIYRIAVTQPGNFYQGSNIFLVCPGPMKDALVDDIPEIKYATKFTMRSAVLKYESKRFVENKFLYADPDFINIFTFPVINGDLTAALNEPFSLFVSSEVAEKYFGSDDPFGKVFRVDNQYDYTVKGIIKNVPENSHFDFDFITGFESFYSIRGGRDRVNRWNSFSYTTYVRLRNGAAPDNVEKKLQSIVTNYLDEDMHGTILLLQPLLGIHLGGNFNFGIGQQSDKRYLYLLSSIGFFILLIAIFNYMNMATARSYSRSKEVGIHKVSGSGKTNLIYQFITESIVLSFVSLIISLFIIWLILPVFSRYVDRMLTFSMIFEFSTLKIVVLAVLLSGLLAGIYPAFHLASFKPVNLIKGVFDTYSGKSKSNSLRNLLVIIQYIISVIALVVTFTIFRQLSFIKHKDLGFNSKNIVYVYVRDPSIRSNPETVVQELTRNPDIKGVTTSSNLPVTIMSNYTAYWEGKSEDDDLNIYRAGIDQNFIDFYGLTILEGTNFLATHETDSLTRFIINQKTAQVLGWDDPVGKRLAFNRGIEKGIVVGIVKDFHFHSFHLAIEPLALNLNMEGDDFQRIRYFSIAVNPERMAETIRYIDDTFQKVSPDYLNSYSFLDELIRSMYFEEQRLAGIFAYSTILAIILASFGLVGLSSFSTRNRTREMVVRKVFGASPYRIMILHVTEFSRYIFFSILFAWPVSYIMMNRWLQNFSYRVDFGIMGFLFSLCTVILVSILSIGYYVLKAAYVNPARLLRYD